MNFSHVLLLQKLRKRLLDGHVLVQPQPIRERLQRPVRMVVVAHSDMVVPRVVPLLAFPGAMAGVIKAEVAGASGTGVAAVVLEARQVSRAARAALVACVIAAVMAVVVVAVVPLVVAMMFTSMVIVMMMMSVLRVLLLVAMEQPVVMAVPMLHKHRGHHLLRELVHVFSRRQQQALTELVPGRPPRSGRHHGQHERDTERGGTHVVLNVVIEEALVAGNAEFRLLLHLRPEFEIVHDRHSPRASLRGQTRCLDSPKLVSTAPDCAS